MHRRDFLKRVAAAFTAAATGKLPDIAVDPTSALADTAFTPSQIEAASGLITMYTHNAQMILSNAVEYAPPEGITVGAFNRRMIAIDNTRHSTYTSLLPYTRNNPTVKALLDVYREEVDMLRDIVKGRAPEAIVTKAELQGALELARQCWDTLCEVAKQHPSLQQDVDKVTAHHQQNQQIKQAHAKVQDDESHDTWMRVVHGDHTPGRTPGREL